MTKPVQRGWFKNLVSRRRPQTPFRRAKARLNLERFESRDCPSSSIPLNFFNTTPDWTAVGPSPILNGSTPGNLRTNGRVSGVAVDPSNPNRIFVTGASGGVWRTLDGGQNWTPLTLHIPGLADGHHAQHGRDRDRRQQSEHHLRSRRRRRRRPMRGLACSNRTDGGNTWALTGVSVLSPISSHSIAVDNLDPNIVFVNAKSYVGYGIPDARHGGVFRTLDGGATWVKSAQVLVGASSAAAPHLWMSISTAKYLGQPSRAVHDARFWRRRSLQRHLSNHQCHSDASHRAVELADRRFDARSRHRPRQRPNLAFANSTQHDLCIDWRFQRRILGCLQNVGQRRELAAARSSAPTLAGGVPVGNFFNTQGDYDNTITVSPTNPNLVIVGGATGSPFMTTTGGLVWTNINTVNGTGPHADLHAGAFDSNGNFLLGSDGGLFRFNITSNPQTGSR